MTERIALFPLATVLFPGSVLPLHVFEERYRLLVRDLVARPDGASRRFGVLAIREGREVGPHGVSALHEIGCTAVLHQVHPYDDGRFDLVSAGSARFRLHRLDDSRAYLQGEVEFLDEPGGAKAGVLAAGVAERFAAYRQLLASAARRPLPDDPTVLSYLVAAAMVLDLADKQRLLAAPDTATRLGFELGLLRRETSILARLPSLPAVELARSSYALS